ncbi:MAG TPA: hypothetical protein PLR99_22940 [Polyangiaceae bacterium]|nr:hypothetical protein [Polyangiaceae bacterium]
MRNALSPLAAPLAAPVAAALAAPRRSARAFALTAACAAALLTAACSENLTVPKGRTPYAAGDPVPLTCVPNLDGKIDATELAPAFDTPVSYLVSPAGKDQPVDLVPKPLAGGKQRWDYSVDQRDDQVAVISASRIAGKWYAAQFPESAFVAPFDAAGHTEAVYAYDAQAVSLLGLASREPDPAEGRTLFVYSAPVAIYKFPLSPGVTYTSIGEVKGATLRGLPYAGRDRYEVTVDATGQLDLPDLIFQQVLRVRTKVTVEPAAGAATTQLQVSFLSECFGEVARVTSKTGEKTDDFTVASEIRRLGLP